MSELTYPRPDNVRGKFGRWVTADMFHIAQRIQEVSRDLFIQELDPPVRYNDNDVRHFAIIEVDPNTYIERLVTTVSSLDARVIDHMQYLLAVPFAQRFAEAEALEAKRQQEDIDRQLDEALENWGWDFRRQLEHDGFIEHRGVSYPKRGVALKVQPSWRSAH